MPIWANQVSPLQDVNALLFKKNRRCGQRALRRIIKKCAMRILRANQVSPLQGVNALLFKKNRRCGQRALRRIIKKMRDAHFTGESGFAPTRCYSIFMRIAMR